MSNTLRISLLKWMVGLSVLAVTGFPVGASGMAAERIYLSGKGPSDAVEWGFYCSSGHGDFSTCRKTARNRMTCRRNTLMYCNG